MNAIDIDDDSSSMILSDEYLDNNSECDYTQEELNQILKETYQYTKKEQLPEW